MKGFIAFGALLAVILLGLGLWTATPMGGGGLGEQGGAGRDELDGDPGVVAEDRELEQPAQEPAQDDSDGRVEIRDGEITPGTVEVPPRSVVTFLNRDDVGRAIDFEDERLDDAEVRAGGAHTVEVPAEGTFAFSVGEDEGEIVVRTAE